MALRALLLEGVHASAVSAFESAGYETDCEAGALDADTLARRLGDVGLGDVGFLGVRSRSALPARVFEAAPALTAVGCFCIGTNHVALDAAAARGVPVFNAPFANSRSVAELTIAAAIMLMRGVPAKNAAAHGGAWRKTAKGAHEVRSKKLGIVGYGNIGSQLSVIASALGMHVYFYDIQAKLAHGNARAVESLDELLAISDVLTLHVPSTPQTRNMIDARAIEKMKPGACLINYARGDLVDLDALAEALQSGRLAGAAIDVFPKEPGSGDEPFVSPLNGLENALLTPHIGGSTQEAQSNIGREVAEKLIAFAKEGATAHAVNFPNIAPPPRQEGRVRIIHYHRNEPGVMSALNETIGEAGLNISGQHLDTRGAYGYAVTDVDGVPPDSFLDALKAGKGVIRVGIV